MSDDERVKRPPLERVRPIRSWDAGWRPRGSGDAGKNDGAPSRVEDVVTRSVELGYRVVDDYIKRGQEAARRMRQGTYGAGEIAQDVQGVAGQLVRSAADLVGAWIEFAALTGGGAVASAADASSTNAYGPLGGGTTSGDVRRDGAPPPDVAGAAATHAATGSAATHVANGPAATAANATGASAATEPLRVRLCVVASRPIEAALDFRPVPADHHLVVYPLRNDADGTITIDAVKVESRPDGTTVIRVDVSAAQAAGRYSGLVVDDQTNVPIGDVSLVVPATD